MIALVDGRIDVAGVRRAVDDSGFGAVLVFEGVGRDSFEGRAVVALEYEAYPEMAVPEMQRIADEAQARWGAKVAIVHRTGRVAIGEPSVVIAVGTPHRAACYEASRYAIDELKLRVPVWKKEIYADGSAWKANAPG
ncbi:MAG: molybdenum cofactor biosynthesis protein MoaE [Alphaproteobacteria bacterium]|nr:molybdenum cofactor biosynthesis protein MoaE [Alphaproteobacteria bacterium]